jgi:hypothetical protein
MKKIPREKKTKNAFFKSFSREVKKNPAGEGKNSAGKEKKSLLNRKNFL